jgi:salicylate hydroxylase
MAVEDGLVLGLLLGRLQNSDKIPDARRHDYIHAILCLFESLRKKRTTMNVQGAIANRKLCMLSWRSSTELTTTQII